MQDKRLIEKLTDASSGEALHHFFGQGLGDSVNALGVFRILRSLFPKVKHVFYADDRSKDLIERATIDYSVSIVWYPKAWDFRFPQEKGIHGADKVFYKKFLQSRSEKDITGYINNSDPEQLARGDSTQEKILRNMGLNDWIPSFRPFVPILQRDVLELDEYLKKHHLFSGKYVVFAPHTIPNRQWDGENFEWVGEKLYELLGIPVVVLGFKELGFLRFNGCQNHFGISLPLIAGIISKCALFVGHDSGLSHVAAAFDIPIIVLYVNTSIIPEEVRVHSPYGVYVIPPSKYQKIAPSTVLNLSLSILKGNYHFQSICLGCQRNMRYLIEAEEFIFNKKCFCGNQKKDDSFSKTSKELFNENDYLRKEVISLPENTYDIYDFDVFLKKNKHITIDLKYSDFFRHVLLGDPLWKGDFQWSFDGALLFFKRRGFWLNRIDIIPSDHGSSVLRMSFFQEECVEKWRNPLKIPWGGKLLFLPGIGWYFKYFSWQAWANIERVTSLSKHAVEDGRFFDGMILSWCVYRLNPSSKSLKYLLKSIMFYLYSLVKKESSGFFRKTSHE